MTTDRFRWTASSLDDTERLGRAIAAAAPPGTVVALIGTLGAGKTRLVQAVAAALGVPRDQVVSPTFVICQQYDGTIPVMHIDAYRLRDADEFCRLGGDEWLSSPALILIEWADRVRALLPTDCLDVTIQATADDGREFDLAAHSPATNQVLQQIRTHLQQGSTEPGIADMVGP